jgi:putative radical SAM enzyme (TIGR03279 family)
LNRIKRCRNRCIFCFIDQMPPGLRSSLYIKDDDYIQSFLYGNFITLTNIDRDDIESMISHMIQPLYISIHSMDPAVRKKIFGIDDSMRSLEYLGRLDNAGVQTHIQIVLMPGINDGKDLKHTIETLIGRHENIQSIGIVPVGITRYNKNTELRAANRKDAEKAICLLGSLARKYGEQVSGKVFLSDEFYLLSSTEMPSYESYGNFFQINNGIGKSADLLYDVKLYSGQRGNYKPGQGAGKRILIITSEYGRIIMEQALKIIDTSKKDDLLYNNTSFEIKTVKNVFFGGNVKATGLLTGTDILNNIDSKAVRHYSSVLIPESIFNDDGLTLDGYTRDDLLSMGENIKIIGEDGKSLVHAIDNCIYDNREI